MQTYLSSEDVDKLKQPLDCLQKELAALYSISVLKWFAFKEEISSDVDAGTCSVTS